MLIVPKSLMVFFASLVALLLASIVGGCSRAVGPPSYQPPEPVAGIVDTDWTEGEGLDERTLYQLLLAEVAGRRGLHDVALENYEEVAGRVRDPAVAERATEIALYVGDEEAVEKMTRLWLDLASDDIRPRQILADLAFDQGRRDDALVHLGKIMDLSATPGVKVKAVMDAMTSIWGQDLGYELMDEVLDDYQQDADVLMSYAELLLRSGDLRQSAEQLRKVIDLEPDRERAVMGYAVVLKSQGRDKEMLDWFEDNIDHFADNTNIRLYYARLLVDNDRFIEAESELNAILEGDEEHIEAYFTRGLLFMTLDQTQKARLDMEKAVWDSEWADEAAYHLGLLAEEEEDWEESERWYRSIEEGSDLGQRAGTRLAIVTAEGNVDRARRLLQEHAQKYPALRVEITLAEAELLTDRNLYEKAMQIYDTLIEDEGASSRFLYARALVAEKLDRLDILETDLRKILEESPNHVEALNALGYSLAEHTDRYEEAYALIQQALQIKPNNYYILDSMGWVLYKLGDLTKAREYLQRALEIKSDAEVSSHLVEVLWYLGERRRSLELLRQSLQTYPGSEKLHDVQERLFGR